MISSCKKSTTAMNFSNIIVKSRSSSLAFDEFKCDTHFIPTDNFGAIQLRG